MRIFEVWNKRSNKYSIILIASLAIVVILARSLSALAVFNKQINYQGKLTTGANIAVVDGDYNMEFKLYSTSSGGVAIWTETRTGTNKVTVKNGLFSIMLGSVNSLAGVDFNQTLYLGINIGGTGTPAWDGEMIPRKVLGAVPAAVTSENVGGFFPSQSATGNQIPVLSSGSLILGDTNPAISATGANTFTIQAGGVTGNIQFFSSANSLSSAGNMTLASSLSVPTIVGGSTSAGTLNLSSTTNATKGKIMLGSSSAFVESSNRLGIGTTVPGGPLHVVLNSTYDLFYGIGAVPNYQVGGTFVRKTATIVVNNVLGSLQFNGTLDSYATGPFSGAEIQGVGDGSWTNGSSTPGRLDFFTTPAGSITPSLALTIKSTGNVGIGTATPSTTLQISAATNQGVLIGSDTYPSWIGTNGLYVQGNAAANRVVIQGHGEGVAWGTSSTSIYGEGNDDSSDYLKFQTNSTDRITINSSGNIGIGTTSPTARLQLAAGTAAANTAPLKLTAGTNLTTPEAGAVEWNGTNLFVTQTTGPTRKTIAYTTDIPSVTGFVPYTGATSNVDLGVHNFTVDTNSLFVDSVNHNVGIGTTSPTRPLHISSNATDSSLLGNNNAIFFINGDLNSVSRQQSAIVANPYINPVSASTQTYISLGFTPTSDSAYVSGAKIMGLLGGVYYFGTNTLGEAYGGIFKNYADNTSQISSSYGLYIDNPYKASGASITNNYGIYINSQVAGTNNYALYSDGGKNYFGGNVGVGTTTPTANLSVYSSSAQDAFYVRANNDSSWIINQWGELSSSSGPRIGYDGTVNAVAYTDYDDLYITSGVNTSNDYNIILKPSGNGKVGVGTVSPTAALDVRLPGNNNGTVAQFGNITSGVMGSIGFSFTTGSPFQVFAAGSSDLALGANNNVEGIRIKTNGNVGIGTTAPAEKLSVNGDIGINNGSLKIYKPSDSVINTYLNMDSNQDFLITNGNGNQIFNTLGNYNFNIWNGSTYATKLTILNNGNVGIGTTAPAEKLDVAGNIQSSGQFKSTVATGTAPLSVASTTAVTNLNADMVDGYHASTLYKNGDVIMNTNPFGGRQLYINSINDAMFRAESRWTVTGNFYNASDDSLVGAISASAIATLFDGSYESALSIPAGQYAVININFNGVYPGYPYGDIFLSYYYTNFPATTPAPTMSVYTNYAPHGVGWHTYSFSDFVNNGSSNLIQKATNPIYAIEQMEFKIYGRSSGSANVTQIDWNLSRPGTNEMPLVDKYKENNLYSNLNFKNSSNTTIALNSSTGDITTTGNVGIGTITPSEALHIKTNETGVGTSAFRIDNSGTSSNEVGMEFYTSPSDSTTANRVGRIYGIFDGAGYPDSRLTLQSIGSGNTPIDTLTLKNGNIGIGDTTPVALLTVGNGDLFQVNSSGAIASVSGINSSSDIGINNGSGSITMDINGLRSYNWGQNLNFFTTTSGGVFNTNQFVLKADGNVGIGTATPGTPLEVKSSTDSILRLRQTGGGWNYIEFYDDTARQGFFGIDSLGNFDFAPAAGKNTYVETGNFGVGTGAPSAKIESSSATEQLRLSYNSSLYTSFTTNSSGNLLIKPTGGRLGIGSTNPTSFIDAYGSNAGGSIDFNLRNQPGTNTAGTKTAINLPVFNGSSGLQIASMGSSTGGFNVGVYDAMIATGQAGSYLHFAAGGTRVPQMTIDNLGNVGIGVTTPAKKLQVNGDIAISAGGKIGQGDGWGTNGSSSSATLQMYDSATGYTILNNQTYGIKLQTVGTDKVTILNSGNVGIGTATPSQLLTVLGTGTGQAYGLFKKGSSSSTISSNGMLNIDTQITDNSTGTSARGLTIWIEPGTGASVAQSFRGIEGDVVIPAGDTGVYTNANSALGMLFSALYRGDAPGSAVGTTGLLVQSGKQTGSGTLTNAYGVKTSIGVLSGTGTLTNAYSVYIANASNTGILTNNYGLYLENQTAGTNNYAIYSAGGNNYFGGNVGIGTTNPARLFEIDGQTGSATYSRLINNGSATGDDAIHEIMVSASTAGDPITTYTVIGSQAWSVGIDNSDSDKFKISSTGGLGSSDRLVIDTSGNIGIGTATPQYPLDIWSASGLSIGGFAGTNRRKTLSSSTSSPWDILTIASGGESGGWRGAINMDLSYSAGSLFTAMTIKANTDGTTANVGIGTTSPDSPLTVVGTATNTAVLKISGAHPASGQYGLIADIGEAGNGNLRIYTNNSGSKDLSMWTNWSTTNSRWEAQATTTVGSSRQEFAIDGSIAFYTSPSVAVTAGQALTFNTALYMGGDGNVGIGTTNPSTDLDVFGQIRNSGSTYAFTMDANNGSGPMLQLGYPATPDAFFALGAWASQNNFDSKNRDLALFTTGHNSQLFLEASNGNVGIGTITPGALLSVGSLFTVDTNGNLITSGNVTVSGTISSLGSGISSEKFGSGSQATGDYAIAFGNTSVISGYKSSGFGYSVTVDGSYSTAFGSETTVHGDDSLVLGEASSIGGAAHAVSRSILLGTDNSTSSSNVVAIGGAISAGFDNTFLVGTGVSATASNQVVIGANGYPKTDIYFGNGVNNATPSNYTIHGTGGVGTNIAGANLILAGGIGTGSANGGSILFQTSPVGTSGTTTQTLTTRATVLTNGNFGIGNTSPAYLLDVGTYGSTGSIMARGSIDESSTDKGVQIGYGPSLDSPRFWLGNGTASQNWQIDNYSGRMRFFTPMNTVMELTISSNKLGVFGGAGIGSSYAGASVSVPSNGLIVQGSTGIGTATPSYMLQVGNSSVSGVVARFQNSTGTCDISPTTSSLSCSSDITLKKNITTLADNSDFILNSTLSSSNYSDTLDKLSLLTPVTYNWKSENDSSSKHTGFIAQEVEQIFPDLVSTDTNGLKSLNYAGFTPILTQAIKEMNLKITGINDVTKANSWRDAIVEWLASATNGIQQIFTKKVQTEEICSPTTGRCANVDQILDLLNTNNTGSSSNTQSTSSAAAGTDVVGSDSTSGTPSVNPSDTSTITTSSETIDTTSDTTTTDQTNDQSTTTDQTNTTDQVSTGATASSTTNQNTDQVPATQTTTEIVTTTSETPSTSTP